MKSFQIYFSRKDPENPEVPVSDETELDIQDGSTESMFTELFNLFSDFIKENKFEDVRVLCTDEVPYDG